MAYVHLFMATTFIYYLNINEQKQMPVFHRMLTVAKYCFYAKYIALESSFLFLYVLILFCVNFQRAFELKRS